MDTQQENIKYYFGEDFKAISHNIKTSDGYTLTIIFDAEAPQSEDEEFLEKNKKYFHFDDEYLFNGAFFKKEFQGKLSKDEIVSIFTPENNLYDFDVYDLQNKIELFNQPGKIDETTYDVIMEDMSDFPMMIEKEVIELTTKPS